MPAVVLLEPAGDHDAGSGQEVGGAAHSQGAGGHDAGGRVQVVPVAGVGLPAVGLLAAGAVVVPAVVLLEPAGDHDTGSGQEVGGPAHGQGAGGHDAGGRVQVEPGGAHLGPAGGQGTRGTQVVPGPAVLPPPGLYVPLVAKAVDHGLNPGPLGAGQAPVIQVPLPPPVRSDPAALTGEVDQPGDGGSWAVGLRRLGVVLRGATVPGDTLGHLRGGRGGGGGSRRGRGTGRGGRRVLGRRGRVVRAHERGRWRPDHHQGGGQKQHDACAQRCAIPCTHHLRVPSHNAWWEP